MRSSFTRAATTGACSTAVLEEIHGDVRRLWTAALLPFANVVRRARQRSPRVFVMYGATAATRSALLPQYTCAAL